MRQIIINADDFGISHSVNDAIILCFDKKLIHRTTLMVNMPGAEEAVHLAYEYNCFDKVGLHLNLTEGKPLTERIRHTELCDEDGMFNRKVLTVQKRRFYFNTEIKVAVNEEIEAQIKRFLEYDLPLRHIDSHEHIHNSISVLNILLPLANQYGFQSVRLARNIPVDEINISKKIYKTLINRRIYNFNVQNGKCTLIRKFGSLIDVEKECNRNEHDGIEMMVHPDMIDSKVGDAKCAKSVLAWWENLNLSEKVYYENIVNY